MGKLFNNAQLKLSAAGNYVLCAFVIISSIVNLISTKEYLNNQIIAGINLINFTFCSIIIAKFLKEKKMYRIFQSPTTYLIILISKLLIIPIFIMVISNYSLTLSINCLLSACLCIMFVQKRIFFYYCILSILINFVFIKALYAYCNPNIITEYSIYLSDDAFALLGCLMQIFSIITLIFYKKIELEIRIDGMRSATNTLAHEILTPLAVIETTASLLNQGFKEDELIKSLIHTSRKLRSNINFLIRNIQATKDFRAFNNQKHSLQSLVTECIKEFKANFQFPVKISLTVQNDIKFIGCNKMIKCVIDNILKNAFQHSNPEIQLDILISGNNLIFQDNGCGIEQSALSDIFDIFVSSMSNNLGIGLKVCKNIITEHGGEISCISLEGNHTTFIIKFPKI